MKYLLNGKEMKNWEKQAMEKYKTPSLLLMEKAAQAVVKELIEGNYHLQKVLVACGTGNNGGDGLAVARLLMNQGISVEVCVAGSLEHLSDEARQQLEMYMAFSGKFVTAPDYNEYTVIVDALFGIGLNREITGIAAEVIQGMNQSSATVVSVDVPSGISADSGEVCGCAVQADATITFFEEKLGMVLYPGRDYCGEIMVAELDIPFEVCNDECFVTYTEEDLKKLPKRKADSHKGTYGKVLVIAGCPTIGGAAYLCAEAAYRMGAGLVKVYTPEENRFAMQTLLPEALLEIYDSRRPQLKQLRQAMEWADVIVAGPGLGTDRTAEKIIRYVISKSEVPVVIDADGMNVLAKNKICLLDKKAAVILTPHILEMARVLGVSKEQVLKNSIGLAEDFAGEYDVTVVLKNARTVVAKTGEITYLNTSGNSGMATGGSGDVLAGILGGLIAQGMSDVEASRLGVYLHGKAGDAAAKKKGAYSMLARDIIEGIAEVTRE